MQLSGQAIGGFIGSSLGSLLDRQFLSRQALEGPRLDALQLQASQEGAPIPLVFGRGRIAGQIIWASRFREHRTDRGGGKGGPRVSQFSYSVSFAVGICEGEIGGIGRIWANGELLNQSALPFRLYKGCEDQLPDPLIETIEGADAAPAFRGLAYIVFENLPLDNFGNRIPNLSFEVFRSPRSAGEETPLEQLITGVDLIPASGEFAYATTPVCEDIGPGQQNWINLNNSRGVPDFRAAIDDLEAQLPNCRSVMIVSAWFGDDLRCGECTIRPGVESRDRVTRPVSWSVGGMDRGTAYLVSQIDGRPAYGGTPSDASLVEAITELKARGFSVSLYPFILMDVQAGNALPDPYGAAEQAAFPWRGRITCHPAPGEVSSPDQTEIAADQVEAFFGTAAGSDFATANGGVSYSGADEWRFRRFILHHAALAVAAGGVDGFLIGSEMRGLTQIRAQDDRFPAVEQLCALAADVRQMLGPDVRLSYAADWSEYFGHHPDDGSGDVFFHLDELWAHPAIDAVALDWYVPLADWRDGEHLDQALARTGHEPGYLSANIEGGEGYDWFYADAAARDGQDRTPITDGAYGKDWVFRYKDIRNWWQQPHYDRKAGIELTEPTSWIPESKPVWFTELGCPAVDKGANQPNVFIDPKSSESLPPHYSNGARDDLIQRRYIQSQLEYWSEERGNNPVSAVYGGPMIDIGRTHVWTFDARPFPDFPVRDAVWSDGANWRLGHWLNGRMGLAPLNLVVADIAGAAGVEIEAVSLDGLVSGFVIDRPMSARTALSSLAQAYGFSIADRSFGVVAIAPHAAVPLLLPDDRLEMPDAGLPIRRTLPEPALLPRDVRLGFVLDSEDYRRSSVYARRDTGDLEAVIDVILPLLADEAAASAWSHALLDEARQQAMEIRFGLPPSCIAFEPGDVLTIGGETMTLQSAAGLASREVTVKPPRNTSVQRSGSSPSTVGEIRRPADQPDLAVMDMRLLPEEAANRNGPLIAATAAHWPGDVRIWAGAEAMTQRGRIAGPAVMGQIIAASGSVFEGRWSDTASLTVELIYGELETLTDIAVLGGQNRMALHDGEVWRCIQFGRAELIGDRTWQLSRLVAADDLDLSAIPVPAQTVLLDAAVQPLVLLPSERSTALDFAALSAGQEPNPGQHLIHSAQYDGADRIPLAPCHLKAQMDADTIHIEWIRRSRIGWDDWAGQDIPLGEDSERYLICLEEEGVLLHEWQVETPLAEFLIDNLESWAGHPVDEFDVIIRQISSTTGPGAAARLTLTV